MGFDHSTLRPWLDPLADVCELVFYDHRGNGRSPGGDPALLDHRRWVEDADDVRRSLDADQVIVFGHSWGGFLAQEYALAHADRVAALILCSTAPALDYGAVIVENAAARGSQLQVNALLAALAAPLESDVALRDFIMTIGSLYFHKPSDALVQRVFGGVRFSAHAFNQALFHCAPAFNTLDSLHRIAVPTLVLSGADDWIMPRDQGMDRLAKHLPRCDTHLFEHSGHFPFVEEHTDFCHVVRNWLRTQRPAVRFPNARKSDFV